MGCWIFWFELEDQGMTRVYKRLRRIHLRQSVKTRARVKLLVLSGEKLLTWQTIDVFATTYRQAFMMPDG